jgi:hypothetical protein
VELHLRSIQGIVNLKEGSNASGGMRASIAPFLVEGKKVDYIYQFEMENVPEYSWSKGRRNPLWIVYEWQKGDGTVELQVLAVSGLVPFPSKTQARIDEDIGRILRLIITGCQGRVLQEIPRKKIPRF